ncbi:unnamed protein product [Urochloa decumbens]|uniref:BURP domain-containing protein n=1 Tax=Urochloa decumbens TaxID=240449 RepID=A0ABC9FFX5_9POAL
MACLLVLVVAATVLTAPQGTTLTHAARTMSPEAFWRAALPDAPMPESIRELLRPTRAEVNPPNADADVRDDDPPPPMNFNYDDYKASPSPRNHQVATAAAHPGKPLEHAGVRNAATDVARSVRATSPAAVFFLEEEVRVGGSLPFPRAAPNAEAAAADQTPLDLYAVRAVRAVEGSSFVVCRRDAAAVYGCRATGPAARAYAASLDGERGETVAAAVVCYTSRLAGDDPAARGAFRLLDVKPGGAAVACHAVLDAQVLPVREDESAAAA